MSFKNNKVLVLLELKYLTLFCSYLIANAGVWVVRAQKPSDDLSNRE